MKFIDLIIESQEFKKYLGVHEKQWKQYDRNQQVAKGRDDSANFDIVAKPSVNADDFGGQAVVDRIKNATNPERELDKVIQNLEVNGEIEKADRLFSFRREFGLQRGEIVNGLRRAGQYEDPAVSAAKDEIAARQEVAQRKATTDAAANFQAAAAAQAAKAAPTGAAPAPTAAPTAGAQQAAPAAGAAPAGASADIINLVQKTIKNIEASGNRDEMKFLPQMSAKFNEYKTIARKQDPGSQQRAAQLKQELQTIHDNWKASKGGEGEDFAASQKKSSEQQFANVKQAGEEDAAKTAEVQARIQAKRDEIPEVDGTEEQNTTIDFLSKDENLSILQKQFGTEEQEEDAASAAAAEAKRKGLKYLGFGMYVDASGDVVAKTVDGRLVMLTDEEVSAIRKFQSQMMDAGLSDGGTSTKKVGQKGGKGIGGRGLKRTPTNDGSGGKQKTKKGRFEKDKNLTEAVENAQKLVTTLRKQMREKLALLKRTDNKMIKEQLQKEIDALDRELTTAYVRLERIRALADNTGAIAKAAFTNLADLLKEVEDLSDEVSGATGKQAGVFNAMALLDANLGGNRIEQSGFDAKKQGGLDARYTWDDISDLDFDDAEAALNSFSQENEELPTPAEMKKDPIETVAQQIGRRGQAQTPAKKEPAAAQPSQEGTR